MLDSVKGDHLEALGALLRSPEREEVRSLGQRRSQALTAPLDRARDYAWGRPAESESDRKCRTRAGVCSLEQARYGRVSGRHHSCRYQAKLTNVDPVILDSARKHGVTDEDILHAYRNPISVFEPDDLTMIIGAATNGALLEIGVATAEGTSSSTP